jgi:hypothetical protein
MARFDSASSLSSSEAEATFAVCRSGAAEEMMVLVYQAESCAARDTFGPRQTVMAKMNKKRERLDMKKGEAAGFSDFTG